MRAGFCWAATILLAVALGVAYRGRDWITATATLARAAVGDHRKCALQFRLVAKEGRVVAERYAQGFDIQTPLLSYSLAKSFTTALVGVLVRASRCTSPIRPARRSGGSWRSVRADHRRGSHENAYWHRRDGDGHRLRSGGRSNLTRTTWPASRRDACASRIPEFLSNCSVPRCC
jgi:hypothetical protein